MISKDLFAHLSYSHCDCRPQRIDREHINGTCSAHGGKLLIDGLTYEEHMGKNSFSWYWILLSIVLIALLFFFLFL
jgi:hypothetical protein